jgi:hypothetical protein
MTPRGSGWHISVIGTRRLVTGELRRAGRVTGAGIDEVRWSRTRAASTPRAADPSTPEDFGNGFQATLKLVAARHLLAEDVEAIAERAGQLWDLFQAGIEEPGP